MIGWTPIKKTVQTRTLSPKMIPQLPWIRDELGLAESDVFALSHLPYVKHRLLRLISAYSARTADGKADENLV
jgi:hypothetical protein